MENDMFSKLTEDVKQAMKDGNNCKRDCLRMVIALSCGAVAGGKEDLARRARRLLDFAHKHRC